MDFIKDLVQIAKDNLDYFKIKFDDLTDDRRIIERWMNAKMKLISIEPRSVIKSQKLMILSDPYILGSLSNLESKFLKGEDINPHLSKGIFKEDNPDLLFFDWGIHHFHLSVEQEGDYFMKRSDNLLFIKLHQNNVYFIDVRRHNEQYVFARKELLQILHNEWPHIIECYKLKGVLGLSHEIDSPDEISMMRKSGVNVSHRIGNDFYPPLGGGITTAVTSYKVTIAVNNLYHMARKSMDYIQKNEQSIVAFITGSFGTVPPNLDFHLILTEEGYFVIEKNSNCIIPTN